MSVPTITSVTPNSGPTRGRRICKIVGTNFNLGPGPAPTGKTDGPLAPSVEVLFGAEPAAEVFVLSSTLLHVLTPPHDPGANNVTVRNIDEDGALIAGETVTANNAYTFKLPDLNKSGTEESIAARVVRALLRELKRQILPNVVLAVNTDYDNTIDGANVAMLAETPGIVLSGPRLRNNMEYSKNEIEEEEIGGTTYQNAPSRTVDFVFTLIGVNEKLQPTMNLLQEVSGFFESNKHIRILKNPTVPNDYVEFETKVEQDPMMLPQSTEAASKNLSSFQVEFSIIAIDMRDDDMAARAIYPINDVIPQGSIVGPQGVIFTGEPGTTPAAPIAANPAAVAGNTGPFEQIPPPEE